MGVLVGLGLVGIYDVLGVLLALLSLLVHRHRVLWLFVLPVRVLLGCYICFGVWVLVW